MRAFSLIGTLSDSGDSDGRRQELWGGQGPLVEVVAVVGLGVVVPVVDEGVDVVAVVDPVVPASVVDGHVVVETGVAEPGVAGPDPAVDVADVLPLGDAVPSAVPSVVEVVGWATRPLLPSTWST